MICVDFYHSNFPGVRRFPSVHILICHASFIPRVSPGFTSRLFSKKLQVASSSFIIFHHVSSFFIIFHYFSLVFIMFHDFSSFFILFHPHFRRMSSHFHHFTDLPICRPSSPALSPFTSPRDACSGGKSWLCSHLGVLQPTFLGGQALHHVFFLVSSRNNGRWFYGSYPQSDPQFWQRILTIDQVGII